jgi:hypothetical protein
MNDAMLDLIYNKIGVKNPGESIENPNTRKK